jgi:ParB family chromosome partitioning protein
MAGKLEELRRLAGSNVAESTGASTGPVHGATQAGPRPVAGNLQGMTRSRNAAEIAVDRIRPDPGQPREIFDDEAIARLADSLKTRGQIQPIRVRWDEAAGIYLIVCGERRWRASMLAELPTLSCVIMDGPVSSADLLAMQLVENLLREDLKPVEQAKAFRSMMDANAWSARQLARELALDHSGVTRALALLELPVAVQDQVERGEMSPATAYEVTKIEDPEERAEVAARVVSEGLSRAETIEAVKRASPSKKAGSSKGRGASKPAKLVVKSVRVPSGKVVVELRKGLDSSGIEGALLEALEAIRGQRQEAA